MKQTHVHHKKHSRISRQTGDTKLMAGNSLCSVEPRQPKYFRFLNWILEIFNFVAIEFEKYLIVYSSVVN